MNLEMTRDELFEMIEGAEKIGTDSWRWGTRETFVCEHEGKHYKFTVECHSEEGIQHYGSVTLTPVHRVEKTVHVWEPLPSNGTEEKR